MTTPNKAQKLREFEWKSSCEAPDIYANYMHLGWSLDDVRITLGLLTAENVNSKSAFYSEKTGSVTLPWRQAKNLRDMLSRVIASYEEKNGEISTPYLASPEEPKEKDLMEKQPKDRPQ